MNIFERGILLSVLAVVTPSVNAAMVDVTSSKGSSECSRFAIILRKSEGRKITRERESRTMSYNMVAINDLLHAPTEV